LEQVWIIDNSNLSHWTRITYPESVYSVWCGDNYIYNSTTIRLVYSSLITPKTFFDYDMDRHEKMILKVQNVPNYDASHYITKRIYACARDGTQIPMSIVYHKSIDINENRMDQKTYPTILYVKHEIYVLLLFVVLIDFLRFFRIRFIFKFYFSAFEYFLSIFLSFSNKVFLYS
jgi:protease II